MSSSNALFGNAAARNQSKNLVEFKAGKMTMKGKVVHPDKRKGLVYVYQSDDSLMHFCWKDRASGAVEDDLIIFPDDCEFKRVEQCTTGRVYILKFKSSSKKFFFWLQEPKTEKDEDNCKKINEMLNNPPAAGANRSGGATPDSDLQSLLGSMSQQQLMQFFGGPGSNVGLLSGLSSLLGTVSNRSPHGQRNSPSSGGGGATTTPATPTTTSSSSLPVTETPSRSNLSSGTRPTNQNQIQLSDLQNFLSNINTTQNSGVAGAGAATTQANVDLSAALNTESIAGVLADPTLVRELTPHLPNIGGGETNQEQLRSTLTSPQFQQAVSMFSAALQSGQLGPVVQQFQVGESAVNAANQGNMEDFVKALENTDINKEATADDECKQKEKRKKTDDNNDDGGDNKDGGDEKMSVG